MLSNLAQGVLRENGPELYNSIARKSIIQNRKLYNQIFPVSISHEF